jgi:hypothetical protein
MKVGEDQAAFAPAAPSIDCSKGEAFAWKLHEALQDWTAKVDTKASIVMTLETALLSGVVAFSGSRRFDYLHGWAPLHNGGLVLLFASIVLAGGVVFPQLRGSDSSKSEENHFVYFGQLRKWEYAALVETLASIESSAALRMLSSQLIIMSRIAWRKHVLVQWSLLVALAGCIAVGIPLVTSA